MYKQSQAKTSVTDKPYNKCLPCLHRTEKRCDGPRTSAMTLPRWCEFMRDMKIANDLTNQDVADRSGVSIKTIERIMAQNCDKDIYRETARLIEDAIIGSSNQYPCYLAFEDAHPQEGEKLKDIMKELERVLGDNEEYKAIQSTIHDTYNAELEKVRREADERHAADQRKIDFLLQQLAREQKDNDHLWAENLRKSAVIDKFINGGGVKLG